MDDLTLSEQMNCQGEILDLAVTMIIISHPSIGFGFAFGSDNNYHFLPVNTMGCSDHMALRDQGASAEGRLLVLNHLRKSDSDSCHVIFSKYSQELPPKATHF